MRHKAQLDRLEGRAIRLQGGPPPTFEEFAAEWSRADPLSKSLYEAAMSAPEAVGVPRHWQTIKGYLARLGVEPQEFDLEREVQQL